MDKPEGKLSAEGESSGADPSSQPVTKGRFKVKHVWRRCVHIDRRLLTRFDQIKSDPGMSYQSHVISKFPSSDGNVSGPETPTLAPAPIDDGEKQFVAATIKKSRFVVKTKSTKEVLYLNDVMPLQNALTAQS